MTNLSVSQGSNRIELVDAIRGFALAGIVISHMVEQYIGARPPDELFQSFTSGVTDQIVRVITEVLISGKFFALFSFLFGLSFFIQMDRAAKRNEDFRARFVWRLTILFLIGYVHSLFYRGDILTIYAVLGVVLVLFYKVRSDLLLVVAGLLFLGAGRYLIFALFGESTILPFGDSDPQLPHNLAYFDALLAGSLADVMVSNAMHGHLLKMEFQIGFIGRWYLTFGFFLMGMLAGRFGLFTRLDELHQPIKKTMWWAVGAALISMVLTGLLFGLANSHGDGQNSLNWLTMLAFTGRDLFNISLVVIYLCALILIFRRPGGERVLSKFSPYGRTALSSYFLQTIIGTFILYNWGLGWMGELTNSDAFLIAIGIIALQVWLSAVWLKHFRYGPLEWLWRSATYLKWQPIRQIN